MWNEWLPAGTVEWVHFHRLVILEIAVKLAEDHLLAIAPVSDGGGTSLRCWPSDTLPQRDTLGSNKVPKGIYRVCAQQRRSRPTLRSEEGVKAPPVPVTHFMEHFPPEQTCDDTLCSAQHSW